MLDRILNAAPFVFLAALIVLANAIVDLDRQIRVTNAAVDHYAAIQLEPFDL